MCIGISFDSRMVFFRGKADCGDIDILITRPIDDGKTHAGTVYPLLHTVLGQ